MSALESLALAAFGTALLVAVAWWLGLVRTVPLAGPAEARRAIEAWLPGAVVSQTAVVVVEADLSGPRRTVVVPCALAHMLMVAVALQLLMALSNSTPSKSNLLLWVWKALHLVVVAVEEEGLLV